MDRSRRSALKAGGSVGVMAVLMAAGLLRPGFALAQQRNEVAFSMKSLVDAMKSLGAPVPAHARRHPDYRADHRRERCCGARRR